MRIADDAETVKMPMDEMFPETHQELEGRRVLGKRKNLQGMQTLTETTQGAGFIKPYRF